MQTCIFHLQNLSALHVGTGQGVGVVDLPIARAKATNLPIVAGSALKGVLRDALQFAHALSDKDANILFGKNSNADHAGAVAFGDANLLLLPIRSLAGTVAYATCPFILRQYKRDLGLDLPLPKLNDNTACVVDDTLLIGNQVVLEDLDIKAAGDNSIATVWAKAITAKLYPDSVADYQEWREQVGSRFVILPDGIFSFLADTATEIRTRIRIDRATRIVASGALWNEENLPADSVLWGVMGVGDSRDKDNKKSAKELASLLPNQELRLQIGGKHTVGRGLCRLLIDQGTKGE